MIIMNSVKFKIFWVVILFAFSLCAESRTVKCYRCNGTGRIYFQHGIGTFGHSNKKSQCPICHQWILAGVSHSDPCPACNGLGSINKPDYNNSSQRNKSNGGNSSNNDVPVQNGFTAEQQLALDMLNASLSGYDGFMDQNRCYGKVYKYNPQNHKGQFQLTQSINNRKRCRIASFTDNGGVTIWGDNEFYGVNVKNEILEKLMDIHKKGEYVKDFTMTNTGKYWCVSYGKDNWFAWHANGFQGLYDALNQFIKMGVGIRSVAMDENEHFIVVGDNGHVVYSMQYEKVVKDAINKFGQVYGVSLNVYGGCILCCQNGVYFNGLASSVADVLKKINYIPKVFKHSYTGHYFFGNGTDYVYNYWF